MTSRIKHSPTKAEKEAAKALRRPSPLFDAWYEGQKKQEEERVREAVAHDDAGYMMPDGTIYAGVSPDTGKPMFATPADWYTSDFKQASMLAGRIEAGGKQDFRIPTKGELEVLFKNRKKGALAGTFNLSGRVYSGLYRSSTPCDAPGFDNYGGAIWHQSFKNGKQGWDYRNFEYALRCVRG